MPTKKQIDEVNKNTRPSVGFDDRKLKSASISAVRRIIKERNGELSVDDKIYIQLLGIKFLLEELEEEINKL